MACASRLIQCRADFFEEVMRNRGHLVAWLVLYQLNNLASNHDSIGYLADGFCSGGITDAKTDTDGNTDMLANARQHGFYGRGVQVTRARDTF